MTPGRVGTLPALPVNNKGVTPQIALVAIGRSPERSFLCPCFYYPAIKKIRSLGSGLGHYLAREQAMQSAGLLLKRSSVQ